MIKTCPAATVCTINMTANMLYLLTIPPSMYTPESTGRMKLFGSAMQNSEFAVWQQTGSCFSLHPGRVAKGGIFSFQPEDYYHHLLSAFHQNQKNPLESALSFASSLEKFSPRSHQGRAMHKRRQKVLSFHTNLHFRSTYFITIVIWVVKLVLE